MARFMTLALLQFVALIVVINAGSLNENTLRRRVISKRDLSKDCVCFTGRCQCDFRITNEKPKINTTVRLEVSFDVSHLNFGVNLIENGKTHSWFFNPLVLAAKCITIPIKGYEVCLEFSDFEVSFKQIKICAEVDLNANGKFAKTFKLLCLNMKISEDVTNKFKELVKKAKDAFIKFGEKYDEVINKIF